MLSNDAERRTPAPERVSAFWGRIEQRVAEDRMLRDSLGVFLRQLEVDSAAWNSYQAFYLNARNAMNSLFAVEDGGLLAQCLHEIAETWQAFGQDQALLCLRAITREFELQLIEPASFDRFLVQVLSSPETMRHIGNDGVVLILDDPKSCVGLTRALPAFHFGFPVEELPEVVMRTGSRIAKSCAPPTSDVSLCGERVSDSRMTYAIKLPRSGRDVDLQHEFLIHRFVWGLLTDLPDSRRRLLASIPRPYFVRDIEITSKVYEKSFQSHGIRTDSFSSLCHASSSVSPGVAATQAIVMELVPGADLASIAARRILSARGFAIEELRRMNFSELRAEVRLVIGLENFEGRSITEARRIRHRNSLRVWEELRRLHFSVCSEHARRIERTLNLLHESNIYHNDADERNLMFTGEPDDEDSQPTLVDFSRSLRDAAFQGHDTALIDALKQFRID